MLEMLVFIDEIEPLKAPLVRAQWRGLKTNLVKTTGWAPRGARLGSGRCAAGPRAPFGHWQTQTFIAGPGCDGLLAPWVLDGAMNRARFEAYVAHELAPALKPGQIVIADNLSSHKAPHVQALLQAQGNRILFLPPTSPDLNPIEMAFSKLKTLIRKGAARTYQAL